MPILGRSDRGDLIINFEIIYPEVLTDDIKNKLAEIFEYDNTIFRINIFISKKIIFS